MMKGMTQKSGVPSKPRCPVMRPGSVINAAKRSSTRPSKPYEKAGNHLKSAPGCLLGDVRRCDIPSYRKWRQALFPSTRNEPTNGSGLEAPQRGVALVLQGVAQGALYGIVGAEGDAQGVTVHRQGLRIGGAAGLIVARAVAVARVVKNHCFKK